jgi:hypothetical protein
MVIFGAGASYDSAATFPPGSLVPSREEARPPLANDLFQQRTFFDSWVERYSECAPVVTRLRLRDGTTLEDEMERLRVQSLAPGQDQRAVELNAVRYYLRGVLASCGEQWLRHTAGVTNYGQLLGDIRVWRNASPNEEVRFVTFNYDTLLEHACQQALQMEIRTLSGYMSRIYKVFKPHGSVNWMRVLNDSMGINPNEVERSIIRLGRSADPGSDFHLIPPTDATTKLGDKYLFPSIALPVNTKLKFECPEDHIAQLKEDVPSVTKLLVIGWRATEPHFLEFWKQPRVASISKIAIVAGESGEAQRIQDRLRAAGIGVRPELSPAGPDTRFLLSDFGFSQFVRGPGLGEFLAD